VDAPGNAQRIAEKVADEVIIPNLAKYPAPSGKKMQFKSARQRAFVMAAIKTGDIQVPYQRTGNLSASYQKVPTGNGLLLTSSLPYAEYVRGPGQAPYFKGTWPTHEDIARDSESDAALSATAAMVEIIGDAGP
jgi:hypothetical protein